MILLDLGLPGMDGYEVARRMREAAEPQKILNHGKPSAEVEPLLHRNDGAECVSHFRVLQRQGLRASRF